LRRCDEEDLKSLEIVVAGAEKLPTTLCAAFEKKFNVRPVEGYGTTELSPLVSVNVPPSRSKSREVDRKEGSVGRPVPGVSVKVVDPETCEQLPVGTAGMLLVKGPNVMKGYLGQPEETAKVIRDGWYVTGDIAEVDADGFIYITGRLSRFSKIGGEMVPHVSVEDAISKVLGEEEGDVKLVVASIPDEKKGERLVVLHVPLSLAAEEICSRLSRSGLPNLWLPSPDSFAEVDSIPVLGSGKIDLKAINDLAREKF
jgi:acyl-[acyl-carrier-protein]-phospholipid O-acyltransferase/long-chain-fatty-acid--[acyl-carrier-protein] ligase